FSCLIPSLFLVFRSDFQPPGFFGVFFGAPKFEPQLFLDKPQTFLMSPMIQIRQVLQDAVTIFQGR
ncbi:MAG: hypothetical protein IKG25_11205, partial [Mogibacterium sp.]|nr:hypothetical protein [Mogibacterium sp.]